MVTGVTMRLDDYDLSKLGTEAENFKEDISAIINFGKYSIPLVVSPPSWAARPGEFVLYTPASGGTTQYFYKDSAWVSSWSVVV